MSKSKARFLADLLSTSGHLTSADSTKTMFGASDDLQIYHDGSHSYIEDTGTGRLNLRGAGDGVYIDKYTGENMITALNDGAVTLFYDNSAKLATVTGGVTITGTATATTFVGALTGNVTGNASGTALTVTQAAQTAITSLGTLSTLSVAGATTIGASNTRGTLVVTGTSDASPYIALDHTNYTNGRRYSLYSGGSGAGNFDIYDITANLARLSIDSSGNVGIGTTSPAYPLEIANNSALSFAYQRTGVSAKKWGFDSDNAATYWVNITDNVRPLTLLNGGNIGIGTTSPAQPLHIKSNGAVSYNAATDLDGESFLTLEGTSADGEAAMIRWANHGGMNNYFGVTQVGSSGQGDFVWTSYNGSAYAERMRLDKNGNVGIGVTPEAWHSNAKALQVGDLGGLWIYDDNSNPEQLHLSENVYNNGEERYIQSDYASSHQQRSGVHTFKVAASGTADAAISWNSALTIDNSGNVGIGVSNPSDYYAKDLVVTGPSEGGITIASTGNHTNYINFADSTSGVARYAGMIEYAHTIDAMSFRTNSIQRMRIDSSGNVGIGTSSPAGKLHINTDATASLESATINEVSDFSASSRVGFSGLPNNSDGMYFGMGVDGGISAGMGFFREVSGWDSAIAFYTNNQTSGTYGVDAIQEAMRITSSGNVGIGTSSPAEPLHVQAGSSGITSRAGTVALIEGSGNTKVTVASGATSTGQLLFGRSTDNDAGRIVYDHSDNSLSSWTNSAERIRITSSGLVGIGTSAPQSVASGYGSLTVGGSSGGGLIFNSTGSGFAGMWASTNGLAIQAFGARHMAFSTDDTERMRIDSSGRFLLNTGSILTGTSAKLQVLQDVASHWTSRLNNSTATPFGITIDYTSASPNGTSNHFVHFLDSGGARFSVVSNGGVYNYSANNSNLSDRNAKKDIAPHADNEWACVKAWEIVDYRYKDDADDSPTKIGVIAQQIQEHCPELVSVFQEQADAVEEVLGEDGEVVTEAKPAVEERIGVNEPQMMWKVTKALQEAITQIESLTARITALEE